MSVALSIVIPALDEEKSLSVLLPALKGVVAGLAPSHELLVIDGGSRDRGPELAAAAGARVLRQETPGFGGAVRDGLRWARGEHVLVMDGDGSHPPEMLRALWAKRGEADLVIASRFVPGGSAEMPRLRYALSWLLNLGARWWLGFPVRDSSSGLRLYRAGAVRGLALSAVDFTVQQELLAGLLAAGGRVAEVPFHYAPRLGGVSKARVLRLALSYARLFWRLRFGSGRAR